ncbi:hypothetical protein E6O75_ATG03940 [Venturia nashicola]|uniref:Uncharacterized protein n=1 Tax=Venturia nashicola TaxID=86259 RepID=A0A4Z1P9Y9_9PEZI|nr:hypothetical protein E6O75_ATG03940 [Venturia nashicola]
MFDEEIDYSTPAKGSIEAETSYAMPCLLRYQSTIVVGSNPTMHFSVLPSASCTSSGIFNSILVNDWVCLVIISTSKISPLSLESCWSMRYEIAIYHEVPIDDHFLVLVEASQTISKDVRVTIGDHLFALFEIPRARQGLQSEASTSRSLELSVAMDGDSAVHYQFAFDDEILEDLDDCLVLGEGDIVLAFQWIFGIGVRRDNCLTLAVALSKMSVLTSAKQKCPCHLQYGQHLE